MGLNERMLPIGKTKTDRTGDWLYTWEVVGWNDPDCTCLNGLGSPTTIIHVMSALHEQGFVFTNERR